MGLEEGTGGGGTVPGWGEAQAGSRVLQLFISALGGGVPGRLGDTLHSRGVPNTQGRREAL